MVGFEVRGVVGIADEVLGVETELVELETKLTVSDAITVEIKKAVATGEAEVEIKKVVAVSMTAETKVMDSLISASMAQIRLPSVAPQVWP